MAKPLVLGLDFGTESVRALLVDLRGDQLGSSVVRFKHGQITDELPTTGKKLPPDYALQHPADWLEDSCRAVRRAVKQAGIRPEQVVGIGVDFTSCTMLPTLRDGTPLCQTKRFSSQPLAWPKLWKHHGAKSQSDHINRVAGRRKESFLKRYGGTIGVEWFFPKVLETLENAPAVYEAAEVWLEAGDWYVWQLVGGSADRLPRSTCQAGYKGMWSADEGFPKPAFLKAVHPRLARVVQDKMPGRMLAPGKSAGGLCAAIAKKMKLPAGIAVSAAIIDAHAGVPGAGAAQPGTLVMVLGTSSCHMLNATRGQFVPGVAGIVKDGILPGYYGYETGQAAVGDAFDWLRRMLGESDFDRLTREAAQLPPGADGVLCLDWMNGCRTPLMDGSVKGAFTGLTLNHRPAHLYRALLEASALGLRWIVQVLIDGGVPVKKYVATGGLPHHNPLLVQIYADVLGQAITVPASLQGPALGAAVLGAMAAGPQATGFRTARAAIGAMAAPSRKRPARTVRPRAAASATYAEIYDRYLALAARERQQSGNA